MVNDAIFGFFEGQSVADPRKACRPQNHGSFGLISGAGDESDIQRLRFISCPEVKAGLPWMRGDLVDGVLVRRYIFELKSEILPEGDIRVFPWLVDSANRPVV